MKGKNRRRPGHWRDWWAKAVETTLWVAAAVCLFPFIATSVARPVVGQLAMQQSAVAAPKVPGSAGIPDTSPELTNDTSDWSPQRLDALDRVRAALSPDAVAILELPRQATQIPVFSGTGEASMTLGAGHLLDSAPLDSNGNIALSAHRDGSFRVLKEVEPGDPLKLVVNGQERIYTVTDRLIVNPDQVEVLDPTSVPTLTLITCYPFHFVGNAPQRYIVRAELDAAPDARAAFDAVKATENPSIASAYPQTFTER